MAISRLIGEITTMIIKYVHRITRYDHVYDSLRDMMGLNPHGYVVYIDREMNEVGVKFFGDPKIRLPIIARILDPQWFAGGGDEKDYLLEELEGNWSSHDGGDGEWKL
jgi:hypothetical protein